MYKMNVIQGSPIFVRTQRSEARTRAEGPKAKAKGWMGSWLDYEDIHEHLLASAENIDFERLEPTTCYHHKLHARITVDW